MSMKLGTMAVAVFAAAAAAIATPQWAGAGPARMPAMGMMGGECPVMGMMGMMGRPGRMGQGDGDRPATGTPPAMAPGTMGARGMAPMVEARLAYLKASLEIGADQQPAWDAFAAAVRDRVTGMQDMHQAMMQRRDAGTALEMLDSRIAAMQAMVETLKSIRTSAESLYGTLDERQKKIADQLLGRDCGPM